MSRKSNVKVKSRGSFNRVFINPSYTKFQSVPSVDKGVLQSVSEFVEYSCKEKVSSSEFSLGNLIAIGADKNLQYVSMSVNSDMNFVDSFSESYNTIRENVKENVKENN